MDIKFDFLALLFADVGDVQGFSGTIGTAIQL